MGSEDFKSYSDYITSGFTFTCNPNSLPHHLCFLHLSVFLFFPVSTFYDSTLYWLSSHTCITQVGTTFLPSNLTTYHPLPEFLTSDSFLSTTCSFVPLTIFDYPEARQYKLIQILHNLPSGTDNSYSLNPWIGALSQGAFFTSD